MQNIYTIVYRFMDQELVDSFIGCGLDTNLSRISATINYHTNRNIILLFTELGTFSQMLSIILLIHYYQLYSDTERHADKKMLIK